MKEEIIQNLERLVRYPSIYAEEENTPFGIQNKKCLEEALKIGDSYGLKTKNLDDYCGYIEVGEGKDIIGILCHLDVVPEGTGWNTNPFQLTEIDGKLYGRGVSDDKGAVSAMLFVMKLLKNEKIPNNKRVRLILGCNEESGSKDMEYYKKVEGDIHVGFTPDATFPGIHGEKGRILISFQTSHTNMIDITGGTSDNAVSDYVKITILNHSYDASLLTSYLEEQHLNYHITKQDEMDQIEVFGTSAHASTPEKGRNAISYLMYALEVAHFHDPFVQQYNQYIGLSYDGIGLGINEKDQYGILTCNQGIIKKENDQIIGTLDIRVPVTCHIEDTIQKINKLHIKDWKFEILDQDKSLYYELEDPLVQSLWKAYQKVTSDTKSIPITTGGGTYAKSMNNCIAFGCAFPGVDNRIHQANEFVSVEELLKQVKIYYQAIINLLEQ